MKPFSTPCAHHKPQTWVKGDSLNLNLTQKLWPRRGRQSKTLYLLVKLWVGFPYGATLRKLLTMWCTQQLQMHPSIQRFRIMFASWKICLAHKQPATQFVGFSCTPTH